MLHGHGSFRLPSSVMHPAGIGSLVMFVTIILCSTSEPADSERLTTDRRILFFLTDLSGRRANLSGHRALFRARPQDLFNLNVQGSVAVCCVCGMWHCLLVAWYW